MNWLPPDNSIAVNPISRYENRASNGRFINSSLSQSFLRVICEKNLKPKAAIISPIQKLILTNFTE